MIDNTDLKYFKLVVGKLAKESRNDCAVNCVACGDKKQRLHLYQNAGMDIAIIHCYNAGCTFDDNQMGMLNFLKEVKPEYVSHYKMERFKTNITNLKDNHKPDDGLSLEDILVNAQLKKDGIEPPSKLEGETATQDTFGINTGLFDIKNKVAPELETPKNTTKTKPTSQVTMEFDEDLLSELSDIKIAIQPSTELPEGSTAKKVPELFTKQLLPCRAVPEAVEYIENRGLTVGDNWLFSKDKFINIFDKLYFVHNFIFIPLFQNGKMRGFYTRSIEEKRFSTIVFPKGEKYWASETLDEEQPCYIFEGIFDAMSSGFENVCAMLSADLPEDFLEELKDPIFCFDNDETGVRKALKYNKLGYKTFVWGDVTDKDMNERLQATNIGANRYMIKKGVYSGIRALMKLKMFRGSNVASVSSVKDLSLY